MKNTIEKSSSELDTEAILRMSVTTFSNVIISLLCLFFSIIDFLQGEITIGVILSIVAVAALINVLYVRLKRNLKTGAVISTLVGFILGEFLFLRLGTYNFAFVWCYTLPPFFLFITGLKAGLTASLSFLGVCIISFFLPENLLLTADYPENFLLRFTASFSAITIISGLYEYSRERSQHTIHANERRFRSLIENSASVYTIIELDGMVRYKSPSLKTVYGYEPAELIGTSIFEKVHPDDRETAMNEMQWLVNNPGKVHTIETR